MTEVHGCERCVRVRVCGGGVLGEAYTHPLILTLFPYAPSNKLANWPLKIAGNVELSNHLRAHAAGCERRNKQKTKAAHTNRAHALSSTMDIP